MIRRFSQVISDFELSVWYWKNENRFLLQQSLILGDPAKCTECDDVYTGFDDVMTHYRSAHALSDPLAEGADVSEAFVSQCQDKILSQYQIGAWKVSQAIRQRIHKFPL